MMYISIKLIDNSRKGSCFQIEIKFMIQITRLLRVQKWSYKAANLALLFKSTLSLFPSLHETKLLFPLSGDREHYKSQLYPVTICFIFLHTQGGLDDQLKHYQPARGSFFYYFQSEGPNKEMPEEWVWPNPIHGAI